jgi:hypothetical protein
MLLRIANPDYHPKSQLASKKIKPRRKRIFPPPGTGPLLQEKRPRGSPFIPPFLKVRSIFLV